MQIIYDVEQIISFLFNETILSLKCIAVLQNCKKKNVQCYSTEFILMAK